MGGPAQRNKPRMRLIDRSVKEFGKTAKAIRLENGLSRKKVEPVFKAFTERYGDPQSDIVRYTVAVEHGEFSKVRFYWPEMVAQATKATTFQRYLLYEAAGLQRPRTKKEIDYYYLMEWLSEEVGLMQLVLQHPLSKRAINRLSDADKLVLLFTALETLKDDQRIFDEE